VSLRVEEEIAIHNKGEDPHHRRRGGLEVRRRRGRRSTRWWKRRSGSKLRLRSSHWLLLLRGAIEWRNTKPLTSLGSKSSLRLLVLQDRGRWQWRPATDTSKSSSSRWESRRRGESLWRRTSRSLLRRGNESLRRRGESPRRGREPLRKRREATRRRRRRMRRELTCSRSSTLFQLEKKKEKSLNIHEKPHGSPPHSRRNLLIELSQG